MQLVQLINATETLNSLAKVRNAKIALAIRSIMREVDEYKEDFEEVRTAYLQDKGEINRETDPEAYDAYVTFVTDVLHEEIEPTWRPIDATMLESTNLTLRDFAVLEALGIIEPTEPVQEKRPNKLKAFQSLQSTE